MVHSRANSYLGFRDNASDIELANPQPTTRIEEHAMPVQARQPRIAETHKFLVVKQQHRRLRGSSLIFPGSDVLFVSDIVSNSASLRVSQRETLSSVNSVSSSELSCSELSVTSLQGCNIHAGRRPACPDTELTWLSQNGNSLV